MVAAVTPSGVEQAWLAYAQDVVLGDDHTASCVRDGGGCLEAPDAAHLRWPGFMGRLYRPGGLLLVGNVHRNFASDGVPTWVAELLAATTAAFRADPAGHGPGYLADTRRAYLRGLSGAEPGRWNVSRPFSYLLQRLGLDWDNVCYTNGSKSQAVPGAAIDRLIRGCVQRWPVEDLAARLGASHVITSSAVVRDDLRSKEVPVLHFPQRFSYARLDAIADVIRESGIFEHAHVPVRQTCTGPGASIAEGGL
jgi:hypothetical protein